MSLLFLAGPLADPALLKVLLGPEGAAALETARPAILPGHDLLWRPGARVAVLKACPGAMAQGLLIDLPEQELRRRLNHFLSGAAKWAPVRVRPMRSAASSGPEPAPGTAAENTAETPMAMPAEANAAHEPFEALWARPGWPEVMAGAAGEYMQSYGIWPAPRAAGLWHAMLIRAGAHMRARAEPAPARIRMKADAQAVRTLDARRPYWGYFNIEEQDLRFRLFEGGWSETVKRACFVDGDAVIVLPYDPARGKVLLVEQFRMGPWVRGAANPWLLEPVAGRIDGAEPPEEAALRELEEETGISRARLVHIASGYPSSGAVTAYFYCYVALCDLPETSARIAGLPSEAEDIRGHVVALSEALALLESGEAAAMPLATALFWLQAHRHDLAGG